MTKSKTDKHLTLSYKKTISKSDLHPLKGVGNGKIDVFKDVFKGIDQIQDRQTPPIRGPPI